MATSGYVETNNYSDAYLRLDWYRTSYDSAAGINYIHWVLKGVKSSSGYYWARKFKVTSYSFVSGNTTTLYDDEDDIQLYDDTVIAEGDDYFYTNADGTCKIQFNIEGAIYSYSVNCSGYDWWNLDTVPRYPTGTTISVTAKTPNSVTISLRANENISQFQYRIGSGGSWVNIAGSGTSTSYTITGLTPATTYTIYGDFKRADSGLWAQTKPSVTVVTYGVGKITSAPDFNDEGNPTIYYNNEYGNNVTSLQACISLTGASDDVAYRNITKTGTYYTFNLTETERNILRNATTGASRYVTFYIKTIANGSTYYSTSTKIFSIINGNPVFSNFTYEDTGYISTQLTGNNQIVINNFNEIQITIPVANKATAVKGATMSRYWAVSGSVGDEKPYSANSDVTLSLGYITNQTITVYAIDSRGFSTPVIKVIPNANWKDYFNPTLSSASVARLNNVGTSTTLTFSGSIWNGNFGAVNNQIIDCYYKYKKSNETTYSSAIYITPTISGNNFSFSSNITGDEGANGFNAANSYDIQLVIQDKTTRTIPPTTLLLGVGVPEIAVASEGVSFGSGYDTTEGGALQVKGHDIMKRTEAATSLSPSRSITAESWQYINGDNYEVSLPKGKYLVIIGASFSTTTSGTNMATLRPMINGGEIASSVRSSVPLVNGYLVTAQVVCIVNQSSAGIAAFNGQIYATANCTVSQVHIKVFELSREV